jgi:hypothetical protein
MPGRSQQQVISAMRACADDLDLKEIQAEQSPSGSRPLPVEQVIVGSNPICSAI